MVRALATDGIVLLDGEVLLLERTHDPHEGEWVLPGGMVERGETAAAACEREVAEEVGPRRLPRRRNHSRRHVASRRSTPGRFPRWASTTSKSPGTR